MTNMDPDRKVAWIVGAGSGMGRAAAIALAGSGWRVILWGRRPEALEETLELVTTTGGEAIAMPFDLTADDADVAAGEASGCGAGWMELFSAGLNSPLRTWSDHRAGDVEAIVQTNLIGTIHTATAALPSLRRTAGVIVVISSYAGWTYQPAAGVAYSASKTALGSVVRTLNTQGAPDGVRACHLCPGDVDSDFLRMRPQVPGEEARAAMLTPDDVGQAIEWIMNAPLHVRINELVIKPVSQV